MKIDNRNSCNNMIIYTSVWLSASSLKQVVYWTEIFFKVIHHIFYLYEQN